MSIHETTAHEATTELIEKIGNNEGLKCKLRAEMLMTILEVLVAKGKLADDHLNLAMDFINDLYYREKLAS